ncbi:MAG: polyprenol monophosphomannose synthase [Nitrososphaerota archaeon]|nr:polyprenol monophosphomannose synthase [Nitrososphaerota archaeon]
MSVVVVLPTYNEKENIRRIVEELSKVRGALGLDMHILFVDDGSPDGTRDEIGAIMEQSPFVRVLERGEKKGLGTAYLDGFRYARDALHPEVFVQMDADLQHPPERMGPLVDAIKRGADVAVASRYIPGGSVKGLNRRRRMVSWGANWLARNILGLRLHDATTGFRALNARAVDTLLLVSLRSTGFIYQVESLFAFKQNGLRMVEVPFVFEMREKGESKMSGSEVGEYFVSVMEMRFRDYRIPEKNV